MDNFKSGIALFVAVFILLAAGVLIAVLVMNISAEEETWKRYVYLLSGVEAVLFAAVGWLFGKEVHREQAANAEEKRTQAEVKAQAAGEKAAGEAEKGRGLARAIMATAQGGPAQRDLLSKAGLADVDIDRVQQVDSQGMAALVAHARSAYNDL